MNFDFFQDLAQLFPQSAFTGFLFIVLGSLLTNLFGYVKGIVESKDKKIETMKDDKLDLIIAGIKSLDLKIDDVETRLTGKIEAVETKLTTRIDDVEIRLTSKIEAVETKLTTRIDDLETRLTSKIDTVSVNAISIEDSLKRKIKKQGKKTREQVNGLGIRLGFRIDTHHKRITDIEKQLISLK